MQNKGFLPSSELMELIDERLAVVLKRDLSDQLSLLKTWEYELKELTTWYKSCGVEFSKLADNLSLQQEEEKEAHSTADLVFHDHPYCLQAYRNCRDIFTPHDCNSKCVANKRSADEASADSSPLAIPLQLGWKRVLIQRCGDGFYRDVYYIAPCGIRLRNMDEVKFYLDNTLAPFLTGVHFTFDPFCSVIIHPRESQRKALVYINDISMGKESIPVSCVNVHSEDLPDCMLGSFEYLTHRTFHPNVPLVEGEGFMVCCSCTDNCANRSKCECWQLTQEEAKVLGNVKFSVGYVHHRLKRPQHSAVYECNSNCKCRGGKQCSNSVVQTGISHRLQLFHTGHPQLNWGLRTLDDIPLGTFVCSYVGHIYTEMVADMKALQHGDEYLAGLDYIEVMEYHKAGYEAEVVLSDEVSSISSELPRSLHSSSTASCSLSNDGPPLSVQSDVISEEECNLSTNSHPSDVDSEEDCNLSTSSHLSDVDSVEECNLSTNGHPSDVDSVEECNLRTNGLPSVQCEEYAEECSDSDGLSRNSETPPTSSETTPTASEPPSTPFIKATSDRAPPTRKTTPTVDQVSPTASSQPHPQPRLQPSETTPPFKTRHYYKEDFNYIIDAKVKGNMARYINHSCDPNLFVQNVFVDSHDLRFPWVAFFTKRRIKAMEELTWDYNYEIGSVKNKIIWCMCKSSNCRKRLL